MIPDGFNRLHTAGGYSFVYRPMPEHQRSAARKMLLSLPVELFAIALNSLLDEQIVWSDWDGGVGALPDEVFEETYRIITTPAEHEENLYRVARLAADYPHLAKTSCTSCRHWLWNPLTGRLARRMGQPIRRDPASVLLCRQPQGCPKGTPEKPLEFTAENAQAYAHYEMAGAAVCPDDELTRRNWTIIRRAEEHARACRLSANQKTHGRPMGGGRRRPDLLDRHV